MPLSLQARKQKAVRDAISEAATELISTRGYDATTVEEIADAAGVSRRTFFRYFSSKGDILAHGMMRYGEELAEVIASRPPGDSLVEVMEATVLQVAQWAAARPQTGKAMEIIVRDPSARAAELSRMPELQDRVAQAYARRGGKQAKDGFTPKILAGITLHVLGVVFRSWFENGQKDMAATVKQALAATNGIFADGRRKS